LWTFVYSVSDRRENKIFINFRAFDGDNVVKFLVFCLQKPRKMQTHESFVGLLLVVFSHFDRTTVAESCNYFNTVRFQPSEVQFVNGSSVILHRGIKYRPDQYGYYDYEFENGVKRTVKSHLRGCICAALDNNGMCIRPCNPPQIVYKVKTSGQRGQFGPAKVAFSLWMLANDVADQSIVNLADIPNYRDRFHGVKNCERVVQKEYNRIPFVQVSVLIILQIILNFTNHNIY
jgi:Methuselah N-terminus